jgi:hypothetical protein
LIALGIKAASKRWASLYKGTAFGIVPCDQHTPFRSFDCIIIHHYFAHKINTETVARESLVRSCCFLTLDLIKINILPIAYTLPFAY